MSWLDDFLLQICERDNSVHSKYKTLCLIKLLFKCVEWSLVDISLDCFPAAFLDAPSQLFKISSWHDSSLILSNTTAYSALMVVLSTFPMSPFLEIRNQGVYFILATFIFHFITHLLHIHNPFLNSWWQCYSGPDEEGQKWFLCSGNCPMECWRLSRIWILGLY